MALWFVFVPLAFGSVLGFLKTKLDGKLVWNVIPASLIVGSWYALFVSTGTVEDALDTGLWMFVSLASAYAGMFVMTMRKK